LDDEEIIRVLGIRILTKLGYTAEAFDESKKAIARYRQTWGTAEVFDAVILDITIPGDKGGQEVLAVLKEINPKIKAVVSSGYSEDPIMASHKDYGYSASLPKPFSIKEASEVFYSLLMKDK
jgi:CheY-like chemotaxis protein